MGWLARLKLRAAARRYARRLPAELRAGWGASKTYTQGQVDRAIGTAGLDPKYAVLGYAIFLAEEAFDAAAAPLPVRLPRDEARTLFARGLPGRASAVEPAAPNAYAAHAPFGDLGGGQGHN